MASEDASNGGGVGRPCLVTAGVADLPRETPPARPGHYQTSARLAMLPGPIQDSNLASAIRGLSLPAALDCRAFFLLFLRLRLTATSSLARRQELATPDED